MSVCKPELSLQYIPSQLKKQKSHGWIIEYYALDGTGSLHRMVIRMNSLRKRFAYASEFRTHCNNAACSLNAKLRRNVL